VRWLGLVGTGPAGLELAVVALEDEPVRAGLADAAVPQDQRGVGLDDLEGVAALAWVCHPGRRVGGHGGGGGLTCRGLLVRRSVGMALAGRILASTCMGAGLLTELGE